MSPEEALSVADEALIAHTSKPLTDIQRMILRESLADKSYEQMEGYAVQHIKNEGKVLWDSLSKALGEKVSKSSFRGALEKRLRLAQTAPKSFNPSTYDAETWVGRDDLIDRLLNQLHQRTRFVCLTGISGIGKTALAECLAVRFQDPVQNPGMSFYRVSFDIEGQSQDFTTGAAAILAELGEPELDPQERNNPQRLSDRLLQKLQNKPYWIQLDALERLLPNKSAEFFDSHWLSFFQRCLHGSDFPSRLVLTTQTSPAGFEEFVDRYPTLWHEETLQGLSASERLELFARNEIDIDETNRATIDRIGQIYEGHPLVLQVIAREILARPFNGNVAQYWERYSNEFEQVARELQQSQRVNPALYSRELQKRVRQRVEKSLKRLPTDALDLLCRASVYRRPVPETFWLALLDDRSPIQQQEAYRVLGDRALVEQEGTHQGQFLIRQHNLIRDIAYDLLRQDSSTWKTAEHEAARQWLTVYQPAADAPNLEKVRGQIEAFHHLCELADWTAARTILLEQELGLRLQIWGYYQEMISLYHRLSHRLSASDDVACKRGLGNAYYFLSNYKQAISFYQQSLALAREIGDRQGQWKALNNLGNTYQDLGDYPKSIDHLQQVSTIAREIGDRQGEGKALGNLGLAYYRLGNYGQAIEFHQQRLAIAREIGDRQGEGITLGNLGLAYHSLGNYEQAIDCHQQDLTIAREIGDRQGEGNALGNLGSAYYRLGNYGQAIECHQQDLTIAREIGDRRGEGNALGNLWLAYHSLGNYGQAIEFHQQRLAIAREIGDRRGEGNALGNLGIAYYGLGNCGQAIEFLQQYLAIAREIGDRRGEGIALGNLGSAYCTLGNYSEAVESQNQKLTIAREIGSRASESYALSGLGEVLIKLEQYAEALEALHTALTICRETGERPLEAEVLKNLAELHQKTSEIDLARQYCDRALGLAIELGIPLVEECEELKQQLEEEHNGGNG